MGHVLIAENQQLMDMHMIYVTIHLKFAKLVVGHLATNHVKIKAMKQRLLDILELGLKDDGKSFYTNEEKADILESYLKDTSEVYKQGWNDGYLECQKVLLKP